MQLEEEEEDPLKATGNGGQQSWQSRGGIKGEKLMKAMGGRTAMMDAEVSVGIAYLCERERERERGGERERRGRGPTLLRRLT